MMPRRLFLALTLLLAVATTTRPAQATDTAALDAARHTLQDAVDRADASGMQRARAAFAALQADASESPALAYWVALCCWRAEPLVLQKDREAARRLCKDGIAACDRAMTLDPKFGEALALKASLQGLAITFVPGAMMSLGAEMNEEFARASSLDPKNPRIAFLNALITLHKPAQYGGGAERARAQFDQTLALYAADDGPGRNGIRWGHDDALMWSGIALSRLGDWAGARERFKHALALNPAQGWVRDALLPEAQRHLAAPADSGR